MASNTQISSLQKKKALVHLALRCDSWKICAKGLKLLLPSKKNKLTFREQGFLIAYQD